MKPGDAKVNAIPWWNGVLQRPKHCKGAMTVDLISAGCIVSIIAVPAGAAPSSGSTNCGSCGCITPNYGECCWNWISALINNSGTVRWENSSKTGAYHSLKNDLPKRMRSKKLASFFIDLK